MAATTSSSQDAPSTSDEPSTQKNTQESDFNNVPWPIRPSPGINYNFVVIMYITGSAIAIFFYLLEKQVLSKLLLEEEVDVCYCRIFVNRPPAVELRERWIFFYGHGILCLVNALTFYSRRITITTIFTFYISVVIHCIILFSRFYIESDRIVLDKISCFFHQD